MSTSESPGGPRARISVRGDTHATELFLVDGEFRLVDRALGHLERDVPPGIYKIKSRLGTTIDEVIRSASADQPLQFRSSALVFFTPVPLKWSGVPPPAGELRWQPSPIAHQRAAEEGSRNDPLRLGRGSRLFLMCRSLEELGGSAAAGVSLHNLKGEHLLDLEKQAQAQEHGETPWACCHVELAPGSYRLRVSGADGIYERVVATCPGWQTQVFLLASPLPQDRARRGWVDLANASQLMTRDGFTGEDERLLLTEVMRLGLVRGEGLLTPREWKRWLEESYASPLLLLYGAHALLAWHFVHRPPGSELPSEEDELLREMRSRLEALLGPLPDVEALQLGPGAPPVSIPCPVPPMLHGSWSLMVRASVAHPEIVPRDSLSAHVARQLWTGHPWLLWNLSTASQKAPRPDAFQQALRWDAASTTAARVSRVPEWAQSEARPLPQRDPSRLVSMLGLPSTVAQEVAVELQRTYAEELQLVLEQRLKQLADPNRLLCLVLMPSGVRRDPTTGAPVDFHQVFTRLLEPAISAAGMTAVHVDATYADAPLTKHIWERLQLFDVAVADITLADPIVTFELGARESQSPKSTLTVRAARHPCPPNLNTPLTVTYDLEPLRTDSSPSQSVTAPLQYALHQLRDIARHKRSWWNARWGGSKGEERQRVLERLLSVERDKVQLAKARTAPVPQAALRAFRSRLEGPVDPIVLLELFLSFRAIESFDDMIALEEQMPQGLLKSVLVREQLAFALNRVAGSTRQPALRARAFHLLQEVLNEQGPNGETCGILGRVFKDAWEEARAESSPEAARLLEKAISEYVRGFEADPADYYPGVNALTLLEVQGTPASRALASRLYPRVRFAVEQRIQSRALGYWEYATLLELAVLARDSKGAERYLAPTLATVRETWQPHTTARNLRLIANARQAQDADSQWIRRLIDGLVTPQSPERSR